MWLIHQRQVAWQLCALCLWRGQKAQCLRSPEGGAAGSSCVPLALSFCPGVVRTLLRELLPWEPLNVTQIVDQSLLFIYSLLFFFYLAMYVNASFHPSPSKKCNNLINHNVFWVSSFFHLSLLFKWIFVNCNIFTVWVSSKPKAMGLSSSLMMLQKVFQWRNLLRDPFFAFEQSSSFAFVTVN